MQAATAYLDDVRVQFRKLKKLAEDALARSPTTSSSWRSIRSRTASP